MNEKIVAAAIRFKGLTFSVPRPGRHHNVAHLMSLCKIDWQGLETQGFLTSTGRFVNRVEGLKVATEANQIVEKTHPATLLFSEDMW